MCDHFDVPPIKNLQTIPKFFAREPPALFSCTVGIANIMGSKLYLGVEFRTFLIFDIKIGIGVTLSYN